MDKTKAEENYYTIDSDRTSVISGMEAREVLVPALPPQPPR